MQPLPVGGLIWSQFPVKVYVESPIATASTLGVAKLNAQAQVWTQAVKQAVVEWQAYLPLQLVEHSEQADITIWRSPPPLTKGGSKPGDRNYRVRSAETRYELYTKQAGNALPVLLHYCTIWLRPSQTPQYIQAAARHELGHALGLWGHSPLQTDALYFSQVRNPAAISPRDVNTLKRVYQQPTRLGWPLPSAAIP
jgi:predicted Zn-dependent protease